MLRRVLRDHNDEDYDQCVNQEFTGFPKDAGLNHNLPPAQPGFIEGLVLDGYRPMPVDKIDGAVLHADNPHSMTLPHIAGEWGEYGGNLKTARMQSGYNGANLVYARNQALGEIGAADPPGQANVTTFTTDGNTLDLYTHYAEDGKYHQRIVGGASLTGSYQGFRQGYRMLRNAQDHARETSYALRNRLRTYYRTDRETHPQTAPSQFQTFVASVLTFWAMVVFVCLVIEDMSYKRR